MKTNQKLINTLDSADDNYLILLKSFYIKECTKDDDFKGVNFASWVALELLSNKHKFEPNKYVKIAEAIYDLFVDEDFKALTGYLKPDLSTLAAVVTRSDYIEHFNVDHISKTFKLLGDNEIEELNTYFFKIENHEFFKSYLKSCFNNDVSALSFLVSSDYIFSMHSENKNILFEELTNYIDTSESRWGKTKIAFWLATMAVSMDQHILDKIAHILIPRLFYELEVYSDTDFGESIKVSINSLKNSVQRLGEITYGKDEFNRRCSIAELCDNYLDRSIWIKTSEPEINLPTI